MISEDIGKARIPIVAFRLVSRLLSWGSTMLMALPLPPDRWSRVAELYDAAATLPKDQRNAFLSSACVGDQALIVGSGGWRLARPVRD